MSCPACGAANEPGRKFCGECGASLAVVCATCGSANPPGTKFCGECGAALAGVPPAITEPAAAPAPVAGPGPSAERRLVSVLFADLVGFTTLSETRDPESVRELLGQYFQTATQIIGTYGGTVEKFIGDAVMAVWGAPTAHEDDAERAVRAALELVEAVRRTGEEIHTELRLRAGVLTGEAAVTLGARNQGMVAGDLVNTASRLQAVADPGTVLVGERTYQAASGAIAFEPAGEQAVKGRETPLLVYRALRVVARRGGAGRSETLEAPFVGRAQELRLLKDFHVGTVAERRPRLVSIIGQGGIGKSRLVWEFQKYLDGLTEVLYWHQGRSPAYGEGVSFWALAEMVRGRAGISEFEGVDEARAKLVAATERWVPDEDERRWIQPRLLQLLGIEGHDGERPERESLFAAWRVFFERIAEHGVVVMVFEDLQWADTGLLDFIEHLMDWSRDRPLYIITLSRPELLDRRMDWGLGRRSFTSLVLDPLDDESMRDLLAGLVPGLPEAATRHILERAEGVPLYAVETVRMLLSEGRVTEVDGAYRPVSDLSDLSVPASLHGLIAARLDGLDQSDRALLQSASVIGKTFQLEALAAIHGEAPEEIAARLRTLVRRELLFLEADPRSPEKGQYSFVQGLIREVAYSTLARKDRRDLHLAAARHFEAFGDEGIAGALAEHYLAAHRAQPDGPEGARTAALALVALKNAADRARSLGSLEQEMRFLEQALEVTDDPAEERRLHSAAGQAGLQGGLLPESLGHMERALELARELGGREEVMDALRRTAVVRSVSGMVKESLDLIEPAREEYADLVDTAGYVRLSAEVARTYMLAGQAEQAIRIVDETLPTAERLQLTDDILELLVTRGPLLGNLGRISEAMVTLIGAISVSSSHERHDTELRARVNLSYVAAADDPKLAYQTAREGLALARHLGFRSQGFYLLGNAADAAARIGDWDWALGEVEEAIAAMPSDLMAKVRRAQIRGLRGEDVEEDLAEVGAAVAEMSELQAGTSLDEIRALIDFSLGDHASVLRLTRRVLVENPAPDSLAGPLATRAAAWSGDRNTLVEVLGIVRVRPGRVPAATVQEGESALAALDADPARALVGYVEALRRWREIDLDFEAALCALGMVVMLGDGSREAREAADWAAATFERLGAKPLLARLAEARGGFRRLTPPVTEG